MIPDRDHSPDLRSPLWSTNTKLIVGLTTVVIIGALLVKFQNLLAPLILAFVLSYLLHPIVRSLCEHTKLSWRGSVNVVFLIVLVLLFGTFTITGVAIVNQIDNLIQVVQEFITDLPEMIRTLTTEGIVITLPIIDYQITFGEFISDLNIDLLGLSEQLLSVVQPVLGQAGGVVGTVAGGAVSGITWTFFILIITYFTLSETGSGTTFFTDLTLTGHTYDLQRIGKELAYTWNSFLRGQFIIFLISIVTYLILYSILGVRNTLVLALISGLAKFVPYVGPWVTGLTAGLVAFFQPGNYFGLEPFPFALIVVGSAILMDQTFDGFVAPKILGSSLGVHPAAVLVSALIAARLLGIVGLLLAAPVLASVQLVAGYVIRKMLDQDPWPEPEPEPVRFSEVFRELVGPYWARLSGFFERINISRKKRKSKK